MIIFDWDGTSMDSGDKIVNCYRGAAKDLGIPLPDADEVKSYIGMNLEDTFRHLYPNLIPRCSLIF